MPRAKLTIRDLCLISLFTALTAVMAQISIPMPMGVPMTMQTFAISLAGVLLGSRKGFFSALVYVLLGTAGLPVFASFRGGPGIVAGATGGFILSFPLMAWIIGMGAEKASKASTALGLVCGTSVNYICGMIMFSAVTGNSLRAAFFACVVPFIPTAVIKAAAAGILGFKLKTRGILPA